LQVVLAVIASGVVDCGAGPQADVARYRFRFLEKTGAVGPHGL